MVINTQGKLVFLRVHDVGTGWGPPHDFIDVECVMILGNDPSKAYGFQLRNDINSNARKGMLDLLRDAFNHDWRVSIDFNRDPGKNNGIIIRVMLLK
jgi:hypothetical protein